MSGEEIYRRLVSEVAQGAQELVVTRDEFSTLRSYFQRQWGAALEPGAPPVRLRPGQIGYFSGLPLMIAKDADEDARTKHIFDRWGGLMRRLGEGPK